MRMLSTSLAILCLAAGSALAEHGRPRSGGGFPAGATHSRAFGGRSFGVTGFSQHPTWYRSPGVYQYSYTYPSAPYYRAYPSYYPSYYYPSTGFSFYYSTPGITLATYPYYPYYYGTNTYYGYPRYGTYVYPQVYTYPYGVYPVPGYGYRRP